MLSFSSPTWDTSMLSKSKVGGDHPVRCANLVKPRLYISDLTTANDVVTIQSLGITHIVSILDVAPNFPESMSNIQKLFIKALDVSSDDLLQHMPITTAFIKAALEENQDNRVLASPSRLIKFFYQYSV